MFNVGVKHAILKLSEKVSHYTETKQQFAQDLLMHTLHHFPFYQSSSVLLLNIVWHECKLLKKKNYVVCVFPKNLMATPTPKD